MLRRASVLRCAAASGKSAPLVYRTTWGVDAGFLETDADVKKYIQHCTHDPKTNERQFDGIEFCAGQFYPFVGVDSGVVSALQESKQQAIVQVHTCSYPVPAAFPMSHPKAAGGSGARQIMQPAWKEHADSLRFHCEGMVTRLAPSDFTVKKGARGHPIIACFNCHGGKDSMPRDDALRFLEAACQVEKDVGIPICHETHRQRLFHNPFVLQALRVDLPPTLKLNADLSHFVVALERVMCQDNDAEFWPEVLEEILVRRTYMMHCRVGLPQSPQMQDPRPYLTPVTPGDFGSPERVDPERSQQQQEEKSVLDRHVAWWKTIANGMRERGVEVRCVPEYGPPPYQTQGDAAVLDDICRTAAKHLRQTL